MKTVNLNSVTLKKNGTPIELMGVTDKEKEIELIGEIVTTQQTGIISIDIPFETKLLIIDFVTPIPEDGTTRNGYIRFNDIEIGYLPSMVQINYVKYSRILLCNYGGKQQCYGLSSAGKTGSGSNVSAVAHDNVGIVTNVKARLANSAYFPIGTEMKVYGVRA